MDMRNRKLVLVVRIFLGLFMLMSGISGLMSISDTSKLPPSLVPYMATLVGTGLFQLAKVTEIAVGLMLVANFLPALAAIFLAPLSVSIMVFMLFLEPAGVWGGFVVTILNIYLGYAYWDKYRGLFARR